MKTDIKTGTLYIVATPIGNLEDITIRAIKTLRTADIIAAEDTRRTVKLLNRYKIKKRMVSFHAHSDDTRKNALLNELLQGKSIALVSDAGTPLISDPGYKLVFACIHANIPVECLPGPCAAIAAAAVSGIDCSRFIFAGFLPKGEGGKKELSRLCAGDMTVIIYESQERVLKTLENAAQILGGDAHVCVMRELTKLHEEALRGPVADVRGELLSRGALKGEFVIVIGACGSQAPDKDAAALFIANALKAGKSAKDAAAQAAAQYGIPKNTAYKAALKIKSDLL